jgi:hypothetical protein
MKVHITGYLHGHVDFAKILIRTDTIAPDDILVILGDFGLSIASNPDWLMCLRNQKFVTVFVDGNHENFPFLDSLPTKVWNNGLVGIVADNIYHLRRGEIFLINGKSFLSFGGAESIDKHSRIEGVSWFPEEVPDSRDLNNLTDNLRQFTFTVDYVLTHTMPLSIEKKFCEDLHNTPYENFLQVEKILDRLLDVIKFKKWFCGHWHPNKTLTYKEFECLYDDFTVINLPNKNSK